MVCELGISVSQWCVTLQQHQVSYCGVHLALMVIWNIVGPGIRSRELRSTIYDRDFFSFFFHV